MRLSASQLKSYADCPLRYRYDREGAPRLQLSATAFGTVMHHAVHVLERGWAQVQGTERDGDMAPHLARAQATLEHFWNPDNIGELCEPVDVWLPRQSWGGLLARGRKTLDDYAAVLETDDSQVLALEYGFEVPVLGTEHTISGYIDRLAVRWHKRKPYLSVDDWKTGKRPTYLRHNVQGHVYAYATTRPEFWAGFDNGEVLYRTYADWPRRFHWIDLKEFRRVDGGWREETDYRRLAMAVDAVAAAVAAGIYPPTLSGETCTFCQHREHCGGIGLPDDTQGAPA